MASSINSAVRFGSSPETETPAMLHAPGGAGDVEVAAVWQILRHRRRWVFSVTALLVAATLAYGLLTPNLYSASAQLLVDPRDRQVVSNDVNPSTVAPDGGITQVESQVSVVQSTGVLLRAIAATDLTDDPEFNGSGVMSRLVEGIEDLFGLGGAATPARREARTLIALRRALTVKRADRVLVIDLSVTTRAADKSARLANAIAAAYLADQAAARANAADAASAALNARLAEQRRRVREAEDAVERYRTEHTLVVATGQLVSERQLSDVNDQLSLAQNRVAALRAKVDQIKAQRRGGPASDATAEAIQSTVVSKLREQESALNQREADLETQLGPLHPTIAAVRMELRRVRQSIDTELDRIERSIRSDYDRALANERSLAAKLDTLKGQTLSNDQTSVRLLELQRERDALRSVYGNYLLRVQETREQASVDSTNARIISQALVPQQKVWPLLGILLAGALGGGLGIGAATALIAEYMRPTVLSCAQAQDLAGAPVVGLLPPAGLRAAAWTRLVRRAPASDPEARNREARNAALLALWRLFAPEERQRGGRSLVLASAASDAADRDRAAQLLVAAAARQGERVLFIDAGRTEAERMDAGLAPGLLDVLRGERRLDTVLQVDGSGRLAFMGPGRDLGGSDPRDGRLFAARMLKDAQGRFDLVVIDAGALTENLQVAPLAMAVDKVVLVARLSATPRAAVVAVADMLGVAGRAVSAVLAVAAAGA